MSFHTKKICLIVDKSKSNRSLRADFDNYIKRMLNEKMFSNDILIKHQNSQNEPCLQVLDFISWAIFRKYEHKDGSFFEIIKDKIVIKKELFS